MIKIQLKAHRDEAVKRFHPWIFSGAIHRMEGSPEDGDIVEIFDKQGEWIATGHYQDASISVRIISFEYQEIDQNFWNQKIENAFLYRKKIGIADASDTNCYRLVHAEGDGLPGLIVDIYGNTAVMQCHSIGMYLSRREIAQAIQNTLGKRIDGIYDKSKESLPKDFAATVENAYLFGSKTADVVVENGAKFQIDWEGGQKTGFFLDQRDNRKLLGTYAKDKTVLNTFCYTGGFSMYALLNGAKRVDSVDVSGKAIDLVNANTILNGDHSLIHTSHAEDVMDFLKKNDAQYDIIIVDPPAFAKSLDKRHNAVQGYKRLNVLALEKVAPGGILFTFSCSQVVDRQLFYDTIVSAAIEAGRQVRVMHHLTQPADHPVNLFHPEGSYLKGLVLFVE
ncbi:MAG: class I SAM-dependent rRNA methyltransferase [Saprospiraceae bacterium]